MRESGCALAVYGQVVQPILNYGQKRWQHSLLSSSSTVAMR